jgi:hypothetical protein
MRTNREMQFSGKLIPILPMAVGNNQNNPKNKEK